MMEMAAPVKFGVRFVVSSNSPGSVVRITADTASLFTGWGVSTAVDYPAVDWWDFKLFELARSRGLGRAKQLVRLGGEAAVGLSLPKRWCGFTHHKADPRIRALRYGLSPSARHCSRQEVVVVQPPYLLPHLMRTLPDPGAKLVSALHMNLEKAVRSQAAATARWYQDWVERQRKISIPRYTTSHEAKRAAERLGIQVRRVIPDGVDLSLFHPPQRRPAGEKPVVTLYCTADLQKGQADGLEAVRRLRAEGLDVRFHALGIVTPGNEPLFDHRYGYLHGEAYAAAVRESDLFMYPSRFDGFPAPPLQAMASGCALVTTATDGVTDYAADGLNALVVKPADVAGMSDAVRRLAGDAGLRGRLEQGGLETARRYDVRATSRQLLEFLQEVYEEKN